VSDDKAPQPELLTAEAGEELLAGDDRSTVDVYIPEWKKTVRLRQLSGAESVGLSELPTKEGLFHIAAMSIIDAKGERIFKDPDRLKVKSAAALSRIQDAALKLNGLVQTISKNG